MLQVEVDAVVGDKTYVSYDDITKLEYTMQVKLSVLFNNTNNFNPPKRHEWNIAILYTFIIVSTAAQSLKESTFWLK